MISFSNVNLDCSKSDKLQVLNEDRTYLLYDHCQQLQKKANNKTIINFALAKAKFLLVRLQSVSPRLVSATFDVVVIESPDIYPIKQQQQQPNGTLFPNFPSVNNNFNQYLTTKKTKSLNPCNKERLK